MSQSTHFRVESSCELRATSSDKDSLEEPASWVVLSLKRNSRMRPRIDLTITSRIAQVMHVDISSARLRRLLNTCSHNCHCGSLRVLAKTRPCILLDLLCLPGPLNLCRVGFKSQCHSGKSQSAVARVIEQTLESQQIKNEPIDGQIGDKLLYGSIWLQHVASPANFLRRQIAFVLLFRRKEVG